MTDGPCEECGVVYPAWWTDHAIWNATVGGPEAIDDPGGLLCPTCFLRRAEPVRGAWKITAPDDGDDATGAGKHEGGLEARYRVQKINDPTGKHDDCDYFVVDPKHDPIAHNSIAIYANDPDCPPALSADLWALLAKVK